MHCDKSAEYGLQHRRRAGRRVVRAAKSCAQCAGCRLRQCWQCAHVRIHMCRGARALARLAAVWRGRGLFGIVWVTGRVGVGGTVGAIVRLLIYALAFFSRRTRTCLLKPFSFRDPTHAHLPRRAQPTHHRLHRAVPHQLLGRAQAHTRPSKMECSRSGRRLITSLTAIGG